MEITSIPTFLDYLESVRGRTRRVVACIPADHLEWRPAGDTFSPGDLVRHIAAAERFMFAENAAGRPSRYPGHGPELADGLEAVLDRFEAWHAETLQIIGALTPEDLQRKCTTVGGVAITTWKWLRAMVEHEIHHRGQIYVLLGLLGVKTPPLYGLREDEVRERSRG